MTAIRSLAGRLVWATGLAFVFVSALPAQIIAGTWQATLPAGDSPRVVVTLAKAEDGALRGTLCFIDDGATVVPLLTATFAAQKLSVAFYGISYQGKMSSNGKSITGTWTSGKQSTPLTFVLATPETLWSYTGPAPVAAMPASADPAFEVAAIKPSRPDGGRTDFSTETRQFEAKNASVIDLIEFAYRVNERQIDGGPLWKGDLRFDIVAEPDSPGVPSAGQARMMLKKLLAERFGLVAHSVQTVFPVYALTIDKSPAKITQSAAGSGGHAGVYARDETDGQMGIVFARTTMPDFADFLMHYIRDRQIVDETGLTGQFDFAVTVPSSAMHNEQGPDGMDRASAMMRGVAPLGLKLVPKREAIEVIVIDHLDRPTSN